MYFLYYTELDCATELDSFRRYYRYKSLLLLFLLLYIIPESVCLPACLSVCLKYVIVVSKQRYLGVRQESVFSFDDTFIVVLLHRKEFTNPPLKVQTDRHTNRQIDRQTDRQTEKQTDIQTTDSTLSVSSLSKRDPSSNTDVSGRKSANTARW